MEWKIGWGVSNSCNMHCPFCYSKNVRREPNYEENIRDGLAFIIKNKDRISSINFGTGEPTIEPNLFRLCEAIKKEAPWISIGITTNGTLTKAVEDPYKMEIFRTCIDDVDISLDYGNAKEQDKSRGFKGAFALAIGSLKLCKDLNKNASIVNALHKYNCSPENLDSLQRLARLYGASLRINIFRPTSSFDFVLDYDQLKESFLHLVDNYELESIADPLFAALIGVPCPEGDPVGRSSFRILPNGYITPSTYLVTPEWRTLLIGRADNIDSLSNEEAFRRILDAKVPRKCTGCPIADVCCGGVIDRRWLWFHTLEDRDPYCPFDNSDDTDWKKFCSQPVFSAEKKSFVHDGYLPTLIFGSRIKENALNQWDHIYQDSENAYSSEEPIKPVVELNKLLPESAKVADLGAGLGRNGQFLLSQGKEVIFTDSSKIANDINAKKCLEKYPDASYRIIDSCVQKYLSDVCENSLDGVIASHIISHGTPEEIKVDFIDRIYRALKAGGIAAITLPTVKDRRAQDKAAESINKDIISFALTSGPEKGIVHTFYSEKAVRELLKDFDILEITEESNENNKNSHWAVLVKK